VEIQSCLDQKFKKIASFKEIIWEFEFYRTVFCNIIYSNNEFLMTNFVKIQVFLTVLELDPEN
jgi:hypothetical protein